MCKKMRWRGRNDSGPGRQFRSGARSIVWSKKTGQSVLAATGVSLYAFRARNARTDHANIVVGLPVHALVSKYLDTFSDDARDSILVGRSAPPRRSSREQKTDLAELCIATSKGESALPMSMCRCAWCPGVYTASPNCIAVCVLFLCCSRCSDLPPRACNRRRDFTVDTIAELLLYITSVLCLQDMRLAVVGDRGG